MLPKRVLSPVSASGTLADSQSHNNIEGNFPTEAHGNFPPGPSFPLDLGENLVLP